MNDSDRYPDKFNTPEEQLERRAVLKARLRKVKRGFGIDQQLRVIEPRDAETDDEFEDALEYELILMTVSEDEDKDIYRILLNSIRWARSEFHESGLPSRCFVYFSHNSPEGIILEGRRVRRIHDRMLRMRRSKGVMAARSCTEPIIYSLYYAVFLRKIPWIEEGSPLWLASMILSRFQQAWNQRRELFSDERRSVMESTSFGWIREDPDFFRPFTSEYLMRNMFELGCAWGEVKVRREIEDDALARRNFLSKSRSGGNTATPTHRQKANDRQAGFHRHLDELAKSRAWLAQEDHIKLNRAIRSFERKLKDDDMLAALFKGITARWYDQSLRQWQKQQDSDS